MIIKDPVIPVDLDREQAFMLYATFCGDIVRTAHALDIPEAAVLKMSEDEGWQNKLGPILALKKSTRPGDIERAINRALNFVQAHKMRLFIARVIQRVTQMNETEFEGYIFQAASCKPGEEPIKKLTTRALADLASAMEKSQAMTYLALNDTAQDRSKRKELEGDDNVSAGDLHAQISAGLAAVRSSSTPRAQLFDAQLAQANELARLAIKPKSPNDNDDHLGPVSVAFSQRARVSRLCRWQGAHVCASPTAHARV